MRTKEEIIKEVFGAGGLHGLLYHNQNYIEYAMQVYAEEYHQSELLKLNKSDVISSLRQCTNCVHYRDDFDCDTCNEHLDKWQSNDL